ncbi:MAG: hypothetical protein K8T25_18580 [Planctomycetia bacterium]|nr:hypothetical protein [Planctomycetia bacterium]
MRPAVASSWLFSALFVAVAASACLLAGWAPLGFSMVTVFLFAGPHNWMEARYFMSRMPARWGRLWFYYAAGLGGVATLGALSLLMPSAGRAWRWERTDWLFGVAVWNSLLLAWIVAMVELRRRETGSRRWSWVLPLGLALMGANWLWPLAWSLALVYVHPLVAIWFLDRELRRRRPDWHRAYRRCLWLVPLLLLALWWRLAGTPNLPCGDLLTVQVTDHAGASLLPSVSSRLLVATHTFLEMLHYAVWILAIPWITYRMAPWKLARVPLAARSHVWKIALSAVLAIGLLVILVLWAGFLADYPVTRDIYFGVAVLHVLAEVPFLLRLL